MNTQGSYICQCRVGYQSTATRTECRGNGHAATSAIVYTSGGKIVFKQNLTDGSKESLKKIKSDMAVKITNLLELAVHRLGYEKRHFVLRQKDLGTIYGFEVEETYFPFF